MAEVYTHGAYGVMAKTISHIANIGSTVAVYIGTAPVNLIRGYEAYVNTPVLLTSMRDVLAYCGYSAAWEKFTLCEAFKLHFDNASGNIGPVVAINAMDPVAHGKTEQTTAELSVVNGRASIVSDTIILDTLKIDGKTEGKDYTVSYDFTAGRVELSLADGSTTKLQATYTEIDPAAVTAEHIIGKATDDGEYTGLGCIELIYQYLDLVPNLILAPGWSSNPDICKAMVKAATGINGHWFAKVYADIPLSDGGQKIATRAAAIKWHQDHGYNTTDTLTPFWPKATGSDGNVYHLSTMWAWEQMQVDMENGGLPFETASNKPIPVTGQYFGKDSTNRGFDQRAANGLNAVGIATACYWGGRWVLWGSHTGAFRHGNVDDERCIFDSNVRMLMHVLNHFQLDNADMIDKPMTRSQSDSIRNKEQEKVDAWAAMGAFIGKPVVEFVQTDNTIENMVNGVFQWQFRGTTTPALRSATMHGAYTTEGINAYYEEV
jgi:hypothetical protein